MKNQARGQNLRRKTQEQSKIVENEEMFTRQQTPMVCLSKKNENKIMYI